MYDSRLGRFSSIDPLEKSFPYFSPYQFAGNNPVKFIDLEGLERGDPSVEIFYKTTPKIDMTQAPEGSARNAAGFQRNNKWFWREMLKKHPEMFSPKNVAEIKSGRAPIVDKTWVAGNPSHSEYMGNKLVHHHIEQGKMAAGIPEQVHFDYFKELHPELPQGKPIKGGMKVGGFGAMVSAIGFFGDIASGLNGNPDSWWQMYPCTGCQPDDFIGQVRKNQETGLYYEINQVRNHYNNKGELESKSFDYTIFSDFLWDDDNGKYRGINKVDEGTEMWNYENGKRTGTGKLE